MPLFAVRRREHTLALRLGPAAPRSINGFTLLESLVALAIFSLVALTVMNLAGESARTAGYLERRILGSIVAENLAVQAFAIPNPPPFGQTQGETAMAGRNWRWTQAVSATDDPGILRIEIRVRDQQSEAAWLTVFRDNGA